MAWIALYDHWMRKQKPPKTTSTFTKKLKRERLSTIAGGIEDGKIDRQSEDSP